MKKLVTPIPTEGKTKEQIKKEVKKQLVKKGLLKKDKWKVVFVPHYEKKPIKD